MNYGDLPTSRRPLKGFAALRIVLVAFAVLGTVPLAYAESSGPPQWAHGWVRPDFGMVWTREVVAQLEELRRDESKRRVMAVLLQRARQHGAPIRRVLQREGLPLDLLYVAMVESGFQPRARSQASAAGVWQFLASTARDQGLSVTRWVDERYDVDLATEAAARFLRELYTRFGRWDLALSGYNMGAGGLARTVRKFNSNDFETLGHLEAGLPFETVHYVARAHAYAFVARNATRFGFSPMLFDVEPETVNVSVPGGLSLRRLARLAGSSAQELKQLNPSLRRDRTPPGRTFSLRLPRAHYAQFARSFHRRHRSPRTTYALRFGETLRDVAAAHGVSVHDLRDLNSLSSDQNATFGMRLRLPKGAKRASRKKAPADPRVVGYRVVAPPKGLKRVFFRTTGLETVDAVADFFAVSTDQLASWNYLDKGSALPEGLTLQVFVAPELDLSQAVLQPEETMRLHPIGSDAFYNAHEEASGRARFIYETKEGDTLRRLSKRFDLSLGSLARINRFSRYTELKPGQRVVIYCSKRLVPPKYRTTVRSGMPAGAATVQRIAKRVQVTPQGDRAKPGKPHAAKKP